MNIGTETEIIEFKKSTSELKESLISLSSMLNKHNHATVYFGIKNDGEIIGQNIGDNTLRDISQAIATQIKPQIIPTITLELMDNKNVIKVIAEGSETPYSAYGKYFIRSADEDRELTPLQLKKIMQEKEDSDIITKIVASNQNLTFQKLKTMFSVKGLSIIDDNYEKNLGFFTSDMKYNLMAELLADKNDISIKVVTFAGKDKSRILKRNEYGFKCLAVAMDQVLNYIEALNDTNIDMSQHQRQESSLFSFSAFKEAWQNACLHTKWQKNNPPAVYIFSDRIEIISTGGLVADLSKDEFFKGISKPVNAKLQKIFGQLGFVEQTGHGVPLIIDYYGMQAFDVMDNFINVTLPFDKKIIQSSIKSTHILNESQQKVYDYLIANPKANANEISNDLQISYSYIRKIISYLIKEKMLIRVGSKKSGYWQPK